MAFCGFTPGWAYLTGPARGARGAPAGDAPAAGAGGVGRARGRYAGIYPSASPGGWRLVGRTDVQLFDPDRDPPALLTPGKRVRLVEEAAAMIEVVQAGLLTTVQDLGRPGYAHLGVARSGALDVPALVAANRLVGNPDGRGRASRPR